MFTISGCNVEIGGYPPSVHDVAWNLARIPRWAGATIHPWSVGQHSLMIERIASWGCVGGAKRLWALWHDAHEFATGDIPVPFKTPQQRELQEEVQDWLWSGCLAVPAPTEEAERWIKKLDQLCAVTEAHVLCHPLVAAKHLTEANGFGTERNLNPHLIAVVMDMLDMSQREVRDRFFEKTEELLTIIRS